MAMGVMLELKRIGALSCIAHASVTLAQPVCSTVAISTY